jgi:hypothetical protein
MTTITPLNQDADAIRTLQEKGRGVMLQIADRLAVVQEREGWSSRTLAEWCAQEELGFESQRRVLQILDWRKTVTDLQAGGGLSTAVLTPSEWTLRPLTQARTQGLIDAEQVAEVYKDVADVPTGEMEEAVYAHPVVKKATKAKAKAKAKTEKPFVPYDAETPENVLANCTFAIETMEGTFASIEHGWILYWELLPEDDHAALMERWEKLSERVVTYMQAKRKKAK